jgi:hypothetical protein
MTSQEIDAQRKFRHQRGGNDGVTVRLTHNAPMTYGAPGDVVTLSTSVYLSHAGDGWFEKVS